MKEFDNLIIGFGKGGKTLAAYLAAQGETVALIEKSPKMYGGTCINVGCIPTKSLADSAKTIEKMKLGDFEKKAEAYRQAMEEKQRLVTMLRKKNYNKLNELTNVAVIDGEASFESEHEVMVTQGEEIHTISGKKIFINTGSCALIPPIEGIKESKRVYTSETLLSLTALPKHLAIVGGGYIGLEFAGFYSSFGSKVTVIQRDDTFAPREDREIAAAIKEVLEKKGVTFLFSASTKKISDTEQGVSLLMEMEGKEETLEADAILIATGRRPDTASLHLEKAGIETLKNGGVKTDERRRTNRGHIYAMGDVVGEQQFTYISLDDFRVVRSALTGGSYTAKNRNIPYSVFLNPTFSRVGMTEEEAKNKGFANLKSFRLAASGIPKAHVLKNPEGLLKAVADADTGQILGASLFCEESHEMINMIKLAMDYKIPYAALRDQIFTHPTMSEALNDLFA